MTIQSGFFRDELSYVNAKLASEPGDFLKNFLYACLRADEDNYELLRYPLAVFMDKYRVEPDNRKDSEKWKKIHRDEAGIKRHYALKHLVENIVDTCFCEMQTVATDEQIIDLIREHLQPLGTPHLVISNDGKLMKEELV
jgi:hypothetical protein